MPTYTLDQVQDQIKKQETQISNQGQGDRDLKRALKEKRRNERKILKGNAKEAARGAGWDGMVILLNEKGQPVGAIRPNGQVMMPRRAPVPQSNIAPARNLNISTTRRAWKLSDCEIEEVPYNGPLHAFDVYMKRSGHTRVQRVFPADMADMRAIIAAIENGNSPVANAWSDGTGRRVAWENATPFDTPKVSKPAKKKSAAKKKPVAKKPAQASSNCKGCNGCKPKPKPKASNARKPACKKPAAKKKPAGKIAKR